MHNFRGVKLKEVQTVKRLDINGVSSEDNALVKNDELKIDRREALQALRKYSAALGGVAITVLSANDVVNAAPSSHACSGPNPPPVCP